MSDALQAEVQRLGRGQAKLEQRADGFDKAFAEIAKSTAAIAKQVNDTHTDLKVSIAATEAREEAEDQARKEGQKLVGEVKTRQGVKLGLLITAVVGAATVFQVLVQYVKIGS